MGVSFNELVVKPALEEVPSVVVPPVEPLGVDAVQSVHSARDVRLQRLDEQVIVIRHQAIRVTLPSLEVDDMPEELKEAEPVAGVGEDLLSPVPARGDVVRSAGGLEARGARHAATVAALGPGVRAWHGVGAETARFRLFGAGPGARHQDTPQRGAA